MLLELARPVTLLASLLSLLAVFHTAFLGVEADFQQRIYDSMGVLLLAAGISLVSGMAFLAGKADKRHGASPSQLRLAQITETFPMQVFFWTTGSMLVLFLLAWYLETHCIFYRDVRY
jgi:ABC-type uncharacterized transport system permease subunit